MSNVSTLSRRQKTLKVNIPYRGSEGPLLLPVDSTGIKVEDEGEWNARKHGGKKRRVWRKSYIGIDEKTLEIRAAKFTTSDIGNTPMLPGLLNQIPPDQEIASVTADGAFDTRKCHDAIAARGAERLSSRPARTPNPGSQTHRVRSCIDPVKICSCYKERGSDERDDGREHQTVDGKA